MNKILVALALATLSGHALSRGQSQESPPLHKVSFPPGDTVWTVNYVYPKQGVPANASTSPQPQVVPQAGADAGRSSLPEKISIQRQGNYRKDVTSWLAGNRSEMWWARSPAVALVENRDGFVIVLNPAEVQGLRFDESSFTWVSAGNFLDEKKYGGKRCLYYEEQLNLAGTSVTQKAWIDAETLLPVAFYNGNSLVEFAFPDKPVVIPLDMPEKFKRQLHRYEAFYADPAKPSR